METRKLSLQEMEMVEGGSTAGCSVGAGLTVLASFVAIGFIIGTTGPIGGAAVASLLSGQTIGLASTIAGCLL